MVVNQIMVHTLLPSLIARRWVGTQTKWRLPPQSVSAGCRLTIIVWGRGPICGFLGFWLQIAIEPFVLFHHSVCIHMSSIVFVHGWGRSSLYETLPSPDVFLLPFQGGSSFAVLLCSCIFSFIFEVCCVIICCSSFLLLLMPPGRLCFLIYI